MNDQKELSTFSEIQQLRDQLQAKDQEINNLKSLVSQDPLTCISNRRGILQRLEEMIDTLPRSGGSVFVAFIDLDGFKAINDRLGHVAGDSILQLIAHRLKNIIRPHDVVGRMGGDEFVIIGQLPGTEEADLHAIGARIIDTIQQPVSLDGGEIGHLSASVGIVENCTKCATQVIDLISAADKLMYSVKRKGKGHYEISHAHI